MSPDDPRHGTTRGHAAGCRDACCREARNADERRRRKYRQVLGVERRIDGTGTRRRIQALWAIGWTSRDIATACGWGTPQAVTEVVGVRRDVFTATAQVVAVIYERLSMTPGPSAKNRADAARKGWAVALAWEGIDIDDPAAKPDAGHRPRRGPGRPERVTAVLEDFDWLTSQGTSAHEAAARVGVELATVEDYRRRAGERVA